MGEMQWEQNKKRGRKGKEQKVERNGRQGKGLSRIFPFLDHGRSASDQFAETTAAKPWTDYKLKTIIYDEK